MAALTFRVERLLVVVDDEGGVGAFANELDDVVAVVVDSAEELLDGVVPVAHVVRRKHTPFNLEG